MENSKLLFTIPEAAEMFGVSRSTIYRLVLSGELETLHLRGVQRISRDSMERFIKQQQKRSREVSSVKR